MPPANLSRGPKASVTLHFDGSASPNPGPAGCGFVAAITITTSRPETHTLRRGITLGHATNNAAEYHGLIAGLRAVHTFLQSKSVRPAYVSIEVFGDSDVVISHLTGRSRVRSGKLAPLHAIARQLMTNFLYITLRSCPRSDNVEADRLANQARERGFSDVDKAIFYPSLSNFIDVWVEGERVLGSHDFMTSGMDPSCFIDAGFLRALPGGKVLFRNIRDASPLSVVIGQVHMTVLGKVSLEVGVSWTRLNGAPVSEPEVTDVVEFVVVDALPVPVHVSMKNGIIQGPPEEYRQFECPRFKAENVPRSYAEHPYWKPSNVIFIGYE